MTPAALVSTAREGDLLVVSVGGRWTLAEGVPSVGDVRALLDTLPPPTSVRVEPAALEGWDSSLLVAVRRLEDACTTRGVDLDTSRLPAALHRSLEAARASRSAGGGAARKVGERELVDALERLRRGVPLPDVVGTAVLEGLDFLGRTSLALVRTLLGRTARLGLGLSTALYEAGLGSLPILMFIAVLGGGVLSLLATQQLDKLGATLLAPGFVAIVIVRELSALMTGLTLAGRLGSANAADLATMVSRDEPDALRTLGVDPFDLLVAPRVLALVLMGPLLVLYSTAFGLLGSVIVGVGLMDLPPADYVDRTRGALDLTQGVIGLVKGLAFGLVVGLAGCYHGLRSGRGPAATGNAVRAAVVTGILSVVLMDAALAAFFRWIRL